jgi:hypothetical protein
MREDIKKRREKYNEPSLAARIFDGKTLLLERPSGMIFATYCNMRRVQSKLLRELFKKPNDRRIGAAMPTSAPTLQKHQIEKAIRKERGGDR